MSYSELDLVVLKAILTNKSQALSFVSENSANLFSNDLWNFATVIIGYIKTYRDIPTLDILIERAEKTNPPFIDVIRNIWKKIDAYAYNEKEFVYNVEKLIKRYENQKIDDLKEDLIADNPNKFELIEKTLNNINKIKLKNKTFEQQTLKEYLPIFTEKFNAKKNNINIENKLKIGYEFFDYATNGVGAADFILVAGESGFGKSLFLNSAGVQCWMQKNTIEMTNFSEGKNIVYFSLEMPYEDCFNRLISRLSGVPSRKIENANLNKEEFSKIKQALDFIKNYPYNFEIIDISDANANDIDNIIRDIKFNIDAVFIDYLGIMRPNTNSEEQDWLKQGIIAYEVRAIGRKYKLPIFTAVQLNRKTSKDATENIGLGRLARSSTIATHATTIIQIENRPNEESYPDFIYHIIKNRKGPKGKGRLIKNLPCATLLDSPSEEIRNEYFPINMDDISQEIGNLDL